MNKEAYQFILEQEETHWWFVGKKRIIKKLLATYFHEKALEGLDIGSGFGSIIPILKEYSEAIDVIEPWQEAKSFLVQNGARNIIDISFPEETLLHEYYFVTLFDVLEHFPDPAIVLATIRNNLLRERGKIMITVPAYQWLWSVHDETHHHYQRFTKKQLKILLEQNGYRLIKLSYFMTFLFPLALIQRLMMRFIKSKEEFKAMNPFLNKVLTTIFTWESRWIPTINFPYGLSLVAIAER